MKNLIAADPVQIAPSGGFKGFGPLGNPQGTAGITSFTSFISTVIGLMTIVAIILFTFVLITGAIGIINSGGDKQALENAKKKITNGVIGLVIVIAAYFILDLVGTIFGVPFLNILQLFNNIAGLSVPNPGTIPPGY